MPLEAWQSLAVPGVSLIIVFLAYGSQLLFPRIDPGPLTNHEYTIFNALLICLWISYGRAVFTDAGHVSSEWSTEARSLVDDDALGKYRYCRKCQAYKPARAHHCKICGRCIPKMDHHCPWTANCVSHFTFPHFMRFLFYAVSAMTYLERLLYDRAAAVWHSRDLRHDLGPTAAQLVLLFVLIVVNSLTLFMVGITFFRSFYALCCNVSTIESWEIERHEQLLRRAKVLGGYLEGPDGVRIRMTRHEFPYDIGIWRNICAGMGTNNPISWVFPLARTPRTDGLAFDTNGFEDPGQSWPPPDPDRMPRIQRSDESMDAFTVQHGGLTDRDEVEAFRRRQQQDYERRFGVEQVQKRKRFHKRYASNTSSSMDYDSDEGAAAGSDEEGWQDSGGNRLKDYGVDEDVEFYDEDEIPLAELLRKRQEKRAD